MKFKSVLVLIFLSVHVYTIQRNANLIKHQFSEINIYCLQSFVNKAVGALSHIQCASDCLSLFTPYCKAFIWNEIDKTCTTKDEIVKSDAVDASMQSELQIYNAFKDGCTNKGYYYDSNSNTCVKMFVDNDGKTWKDARIHCQTNGGDLISITTKAKWDLVANFTSCISNMWIGLKEERWVTNVRFQNVFNVTAQFNKYDSAYIDDHEQDCGTFISASAYYVLQDESCNFRLKKTYVCEIWV
ncbi:MRC [Mytilus coruscus]|uniref:MRC n=1 Tax=Mytilus coruscus TaxID=42192 RepID=A0A6J8B4L6_MYTCO|nr:MRC [Mytilus coruscus]